MSARDGLDAIEICRFTAPRVSRPFATLPSKLKDGVIGRELVDS